MALAWQLAKRFRQAKVQNRFISFISMSSTVGIGLGCFVLITLLSVMNGFERELTQRILTVIPHGELYSTDKTGIENLDAQLYRLNQDPRIAKVEPYTPLTGMLQFKGELKAISLTGIAADAQNTFSRQVTDEHWQNFALNSDSVLIGKGIANKLNIVVGDTVQALIPVTTKDLQIGRASCRERV